LGSVTVVVSPAELPLLPALLVLEGFVPELLPLLGVESSLELPQPVRAQSRTNTQGSAMSAAPGHRRVSPLRAELREALRISECFIVYSHCAIARTTHEYPGAGAPCPSRFESTHDRASRERNGSDTPTFAPAECSERRPHTPRARVAPALAGSAFNRNVGRGSHCPATLALQGRTWPPASDSIRCGERGEQYGGLS
jgi:hypothetical protein